MATQLKEPETQIDETPPDEGQSGARDYEAEARLKGWRPPEEYTGKGEPLSAEAFLEKSDENLGLAKNTIKQLEKRLSVVEGENKRIKKAYQTVEQRAYDSAMETIKVQMRDAVAVGDEATFNKLDEKAEQLRKDMGDGAPGRAPVSAAEASKAFVAARRENPWFDKGALASASEMEAEARIRATQIFDEMVADGEDKLLVPSEFFEKAFGQVYDEFPDLNKKVARQKPQSDVAGVTRAPGRGLAKTGANLPPEAKAQAKRFYDRGDIRAKSLTEAYDKYAQDWDWS